MSDSARSLATGVTVIPRNPDRPSDHKVLADLVERYEATAVVVGLPLSLSGRTGPAAAAVLEEVEQIRQTLNVPVDTVDERFSTVVASGALRDAGRPSRRRREVVDAVAASVLLQGWLDAAKLREDARR